MRRFTWMVPAVAFLVAMTIGACGGNGTPNPNPTPTPTVTPTVTPVPTSGSGSCASTDANTGRKVIYAGVQGNSTFPDVNATYVGTITCNVGTFILVSFAHLRSAIYVDYTQLLLEATYTPTVVGRSVIYNGPAVSGKFPAPAAPPAYTGTITRAYVTWAPPPPGSTWVGWFEVLWAAPLNKTIAVRFSEVLY